MVTWRGFNFHVQFQFHVKWSALHGYQLASRARMGSSSSSSTSNALSCSACPGNGTVVIFNFPCDLHASLHSVTIFLATNGLKRGCTSFECTLTGLSKLGLIYDIHIYKKKSIYYFQLYYTYELTTTNNITLNSYLNS